MQCINPLKSSFDSKGQRTFRQADMMPGLIASQFGCRKCLPCRLNIAREKAIRCIHEAKCHDYNIFLTLTYNDESLRSPKLQYIDFQLFMKRLREHRVRDIQTKELRDALYIPYMVTGEYGEHTKRPHWHAILFNYIPADAKRIRVTARDETVYGSKFLTELWGAGNIEFGSVTMDSAGYVARYAAKKLVHGHDGHDFEPIHKTSSRRAIGRSWIERHWKFTFTHGYVVLPNGSFASIPRYYVDWLKKEKPEAYDRYVTQIRPKIAAIAEEKLRKDEAEYWAQVWSKPFGFKNPLPRAKVKETILKSKFQILQERLKL